MRDVLTVLAVLAFLAVLLRLARSLLRAIGRSAERVVAGQALDARAQRGDLTGMAEAGEWRRAAGQKRIRAFTTVALWAALLVVPPYTSWTRIVYAAYSLLWVASLITRRGGVT